MHTMLLQVERHKLNADGEAAAEMGGDGTVQAADERRGADDAALGTDIRLFLLIPTFWTPHHARLLGHRTDGEPIRRVRG